MAQFTWGTGVPNTGALRTSYISKKIYTAAIAECVFMDHVDAEDGFGKGEGESVTLTRIGRNTELSTYSLSEADRIGERMLTVTGKVGVVGEFGAAIVHTKLAQHLATFDVQNQVQRELKDEMKLSLDTSACLAFKQTLFKYVPTGITSATTATNGTAPTSALANMNVYHAEQIRDLLYGTYKVAPVDGSNYVGIFNWAGLRGIKRDPTWEEWQKYMHPEAKFNSEVGRLEQIRFVETNHGSTTFGGPGLNVIGTSDVLGEGVVFGQDCVRFVESLTPEIVMGQPDDFGRIRSCAWYGIYTFIHVWDTANAGELKCIHVTSSD